MRHVERRKKPEARCVEVDEFGSSVGELTKEQRIRARGLWRLMLYDGTNELLELVPTDRDLLPMELHDDSIKPDKRRKFARHLFHGEDFSYLAAIGRGLEKLTQQYGAQGEPEEESK